MTEQAKFEIRQTSVNGSKAVLLIVHDAHRCTGLIDLLDELKVPPTVGMLAHRSTVCTTRRALDEIRERLRPYCDERGVFVRPIAGTA